MPLNQGMSKYFYASPNKILLVTKKINFFLSNLIANTCIYVGINEIDYNIMAWPTTNRFINAIKS